MKKRTLAPFFVKAWPRAWYFVLALSFMILCYTCTTRNKCVTRVYVPFVRGLRDVIFYENIHTRERKKEKTYIDISRSF